MHATQHCPPQVSERGFIQYTLHRFLPDGARCARRSRCGADDEEDHGDESLDDHVEEDSLVILDRNFNSINYSSKLGGRYEIVNRYVICFSCLVLF